VTILSIILAQGAFYAARSTPGGLGDALYLAGVALALSVWIWLLLDAAVLPPGPGPAILLVLYGVLIGFALLELPAPSLPPVDPVAGKGLWTPVERLADWAHAAGPPVIFTLGVMLGVARVITGMRGSHV